MLQCADNMDMVTLWEFIKLYNYDLCFWYACYNSINLNSKQIMRGKRNNKILTV